MLYLEKAQGEADDADPAKLNARKVGPFCLICSF